MNAKEILEKAQKSIDEYISAAKNAFADLSEKLKTKFQSKKAGESQEQDSTENVAQASDDSDTTKNDSDVTETKDTAESVQKPKRAGRTIALAILGVIASLVFVAAIVIALKPSLLRGKTNSDTYEFSNFVKKFANVFMRIKFTKYNGDTKLQVLQAFFTGLGLVIFGVLKIFILLAAKSGTKKAVSSLTLAMTYFACFMIPDKFLLFSIFILLLYFTFDYSCGFSTRVVLIKLGVVILSEIVIYIAVHFAINPALPQAARTIFKALEMQLPPLW